ncbi:hypothetical protein BDV18DRAFT_143729, partial [Aspergillus unguis]
MLIWILWGMMLLRPFKSHTQILDSLPVNSYSHELRINLMIVRRAQIFGQCFPSLLCGGCIALRPSGVGHPGLL